LLSLVTDFQTRGIGFISLNDSIDTTTAQGRLIFNLFASLAEFERDLIRERTKARLSAARARGRMGGKKKGLTPDAIQKAETVKTLYQQGKRTDDIAKILRIGRATVYRYLEYMQVKRNQGT
jgi:DNA invertase Pin-like site-specific DNA recombinase